MASGFTEFRKPQIDSVTTRPKREKLGCLCADCLFIEQHYQQPDSIEATGFCACNLCDKLAIYQTAKRRSTRKVLYCLYMLLLRVRWRRDNNSVLLADYKTSKKEFDEITTILNFSGAWVQGSCICMKVFRYSFWETILMFFNHLHLSLSDRYKIFTSDWIWIEVCQNAVVTKIDITMTTINNNNNFVRSRPATENPIPGT